MSRRIRVSVRHCWMVALAVLLLVAVAVFLRPWAQAALLLVDAAELRGPFGWLAKLGDPVVQTEEVQVSTRYGAIRGRVYMAGAATGKAAVLVHGLHAAGIGEERLEPFARRLAVRGVAVLTPEMEELRRYRISPQTTDKIEDAVSWLLGQQRLAVSGRVGLIGISFSGGLSVVAAGRPSIRDRISFVLSVGGHGELHRTARYLCTGQLPEDRGYFRPHDYGLGILLLNLSHRLVPADQIGGLEAGIAAFLQQDYPEGRRMISSLPLPASRILTWVDARDASRVGRLLLPHLSAFASDPGLSPERSDPPVAPVFLLHGQADNLIPAAETELLARRFLGKTSVHWLITPLISHVELGHSAGVRDMWRLEHFLEELFEALNR
ncbi:MAG: alpha/beta hydrolase [Acidobacteria bacterium]|nr:alpha/beta hydrolase [Acidobacteriota bacterium]